MNTSEQCKIPVLVVIFLGIIGILLSGGVLFLTYHNKTIDGGLFGLAGSAVGALGALLTQTRTPTQRGTDANPVAVKADEPLPVELAPDGAGETP